MHTSVIEGINNKIKVIKRMANVLFASFRAFTRHIGTVLTDVAVYLDFVLSVTTSARQSATRKNILVAA